MRTILNLSLPQELALVVDSAVDSGNYASKSEFFRIFAQLDGKSLTGRLKTSQKNLPKARETVEIFKRFALRVMKLYYSGKFAKEYKNYLGKLNGRRKRKKRSSGKTLLIPGLKLIN